MNYIYFVVYKSFCNGDFIGEGSTEMICKQPIESIEIIRLFESSILAKIKTETRRQDVNKVTVVWYNLLRTEDLLGT